MRVLYLLILFSFSSEATTCVSTDEALELWSKKFSSTINVEINESVDGFDVLAWLPNYIEKMPLSSVVFHLGDKERPVFSSELAIFEEGGKKAVYFTTSREQKPND